MNKEIDQRPNSNEVASLKTIVVVTTKYIGSDRLFGKNEINLDFADKRHVPLKEFWGSYIKNRVYNSGFEFKDFDGLVDSDAIGNNREISAKVFEKIEDAKSDLDFIEILSHYNKKKSWDGGKIEENKYDRIYKLDSENNTCEAYALYQLPDSIVGNKKESILENWRDAIRRSFEPECDSLYIILHGRTDYNSSEEFRVLESINSKCKIAVFKHEVNDDPIAKLLATPGLNAEVFTSEIKSLFEANVMQQIKKKEAIKEAIRISQLP